MYWQHRVQELKARLNLLTHDVMSLEEPFSSSRRNRAVPTITPSATSANSVAFSGDEMPNPTSIGFLQTDDLMRRMSPIISRETVPPVTPVVDTQ